MQGQAAHFVKFAPEKIEYGIKRYTDETRRLYGVIEKALSDGRQWLAAGEHTIADMANFSWTFVHQMAGKTCSLALYFVSDSSVCYKPDPHPSLRSVAGSVHISCAPFAYV